VGVLDGQTVLVTGGGNGIGRDCALIAAREGARVVVNDLGGGLSGDDPGSAGPAEAVARQIRADGGEAVANTESVADYHAVERMVEQALDTFGSLHSVINPAGILRDRMFHKMSEDDWDQVIEVHLRGTFNVCRATIERFRDQQEGAYVLFTSTSGLFGNVGQANYGAAKMGVAGLSRIIAMEGERNNVRSNVIAPAAWTRMTQAIPVKDERGVELQKMLAEKMRPDQPAKLAVALASPSTDVSGQIFGAKGDEISIYSQPRPIQRLEREAGWTPTTIISQGLSEMAPSFTGLRDKPSVVRDDA
jgi:NAD(P)-dependent dehydrogenase (short-subunit alcohol dehydrogenase family)